MKGYKYHYCWTLTETEREKVDENFIKVRGICVTADEQFGNPEPFIYVFMQSTVVGEGVIYPPEGREGRIRRWQKMNSSADFSVADAMEYGHTDVLWNRTTFRPVMGAITEIYSPTDFKVSNGTGPVEIQRTLVEYIGDLWKGNVI